MRNLKTLTNHLIASGYFRDEHFLGNTWKERDLALCKGDIFTIIGNECIFSEPIPNKIQFILVKNQYGNIKKFYPSSLFKSVMPYNEDGCPVGDRICSKTAVRELIDNCCTYAEVMETLIGRTLFVRDIMKVRTCLPNGEFVIKQILVFDFK